MSQPHRIMQLEMKSLELTREILWNMLTWSHAFTEGLNAQLTKKDINYLYVSMKRYPIIDSQHIRIHEQAR